MPSLADTGRKGRMNYVLLNNIKWGRNVNEII